MKPDWTYIDSEDDIERFIEGAILELTELCPLECSFDDRENFEQISLTKFALTMLLEEIRKHRCIPICAIIEDFAQRMERYSYKNIDTSYVFSVAYKTAQNVLNTIGEYS